MLKKAVQQGRSERRGEEVRTVLRVTVRHCNESWRTDKPLQYFEYPRCALNVERLSDARTMPGERRVSDFGELSRAARWGWAGEKSDFFSILLRSEKLR
jgi:hypothetical protein